MNPVILSKIIKEYSDKIPATSAHGQKKPILFIFVGLPTSGKTTLAVQIEANLPAIRIATDDIKMYFGDKSEYTTKDLFKIQRLIIEDLSKTRVHIISDSNSAKKIYRTEMVKLAQFIEYQPFVVYCKAPGKILRKRMELRRGQRFFSTEEQMNNYEKEFEEPVNVLTIETDKLCIEDCLKLVYKKIKQYD